MTRREAGQAQRGPWVPAIDGSGNVVALHDASGASVAQYNYSPFGKLLRATHPAARYNPLRFATKYHDQETGHYCYQHRYYSPDLERFLSRDPSSEAGGANLYGFAANDPVSKSDVFGLSVIVVDGEFFSSVKPTAVVNSGSIGGVGFGTGGLSLGSNRIGGSGGRGGSVRLPGSAVAPPPTIEAEQQVIRAMRAFIGRQL